MHRILILWLLAIGFLSFAVDSSSVVLQAKKIRETSMVLTWSPIEEASKYKVFYDELGLIDQKDPTPLLATEFSESEEIEITKLMSGVEYYFVVRGYDRDGNDIGVKSYPLHARTFRAVTMDVAKDPYIRDKKTIVLTFTRPIDVTKTEVTVKNLATQKPRTLDTITTDPNDTRIIYVTLKGSLEPGVTHEIMMQKVVSTSSIELSAEKRIPMTLAWVGETPQEVDSSVLPGEIVPEPDVAIDVPADSLPIEPAPSTSSEPISADETEIGPVLSPVTVPEERDITEPVPIDALPQTGPVVALLVFLGIVGAYICKKSSQRIES